MSRYEIGHGDYFIVVGWDRPLNTYFATVKSIQNKEVEDPLIWMRAWSGEYRVVEIFQAALIKQLKRVGVENFTLSEELQGQHTQDRDDNPSGSRWLPNHWKYQNFERCGLLTIDFVAS